MDLDRGSRTWSGRDGVDVGFGDGGEAEGGCRGCVWGVVGLGGVVKRGAGGGSEIRPGVGVS